MLAPQSIIRRGDKHVETDMADQTVMMSIEKGKYYALEGTAKTIWTHLADPMSVQELVDGLVSTYEIDADQCMTDVMIFLAEMMENELVVSETVK